VPPSIREAALGVGASKLQVVTHHVVPLAMPGILTGTIIGMAHALGETAPLLMIGMVAFIVDIPGGITDAATVLPVQIYIWADSPERAFVERTSAAIMVLLAVLLLMNGLPSAAPPVRAALVNREEGTGYEPVDGNDGDDGAPRGSDCAGEDLRQGRQRPLWRQACAEERVDRHQAAGSDRLHRPVRLRQVHFLRCIG
jgi:hypothetical protein